MVKNTGNTCFSLSMLQAPGGNEITPLQLAYSQRGFQGLCAIGLDHGPELGTLCLTILVSIVKLSTKCRIQCP